MEDWDSEDDLQQFEAYENESYTEDEDAMGPEDGQWDSEEDLQAYENDVYSEDIEAYDTEDELADMEYY